MAHIIEQTTSVPAAALPNLQRRWSDSLAAAPQSDPSTPWSMAEHWPALVATLSEQAVESSHLVLRALDFLVGAGRLRRAEAKALSEALYRLRDTSLRAQQITRLSSGRIRQAKDRVALAEVVQSLLDERREEFTAARVDVRGVLSPVDVLLDPPVAVSLVNTIIDWTLTFSKEMVLTLDTPVWPAPARLLVRVTTAPRPAPDQPPPGPPAGAWGTKGRGRRLDDGLCWILLRQMAASANVTVTRSGGDGMALLTVEFPQTFMSAEGVSSVDLFDDNSPAADALLNAWVLVIAQDPSLRSAAVEALRLAGVSAKAVGSAVDARSVIAEAMPNALVVAFDAQGEDFAALRAEFLGPDARCPVVEITKDSPSFHTCGFEGFEIAKVGRDDLRKELAPTVLFELAKIA